MADDRSEEGIFQMISTIASLANIDSATSYSTLTNTQNPAQTPPPQPVEDSIQLSTAALIALQTPEQIFDGAAAGDPKAIAIIEKDQNPLAIG
jgi:hypothetical protein